MHSSRKLHPRCTIFPCLFLLLLCLVLANFSLGLLSLAAPSSLLPTSYPPFPSSPLHILFATFVSSPISLLFLHPSLPHRRLPNRNSKHLVPLIGKFPSSAPRGKAMTEGSGRQLGTAGALSLSVISSVSIVICNKALLSTFDFNFATTLTSWHLLVTFCSLHVAQMLKWFDHKPFDPWTVMGFGILNGISIGLLNLSLGFNSVGFYQMTKLAIIPCTILLETIFLGKKFSRQIQSSLLILLIGVGIATITDLQLNVLGCVLSLLAIATTCVAQIMTNTIQKSFKVSSTQLLYQSCPYQAATLFLVGPFLDALLTKENVFSFKFTPVVLFFIILSCLISVSVNFSTFLVIGKTSPVTYQVLGHLKTCLVLAFGYILLNNPFSWRNIFGIAVAVVGMGLYSFFCIEESQQKATEASSQIPWVLTEKETDPLVVVENASNQTIDDETSPMSPLWNKTGSERDL